MPFPAWASGWFGTQSNARNAQRGGSAGCLTRAGNEEGLFVGTPAGGVAIPFEVAFNSSFGASLVSFKLDIASHTSTTLTAYDKANALSYSQALTPTFGADPGQGIYASYILPPTNGISRFAISGNALGQGVYRQSGRHHRARTRNCGAAAELRCGC